MRYQERIYIQNDNRAVRNKDILNVNMSSDFCIFKSPTFGISGATKIKCDEITFSLSGYSFPSMLTGATATCFSGMSTSCFSGTSWQTRILEDDTNAYSGTFFSSSVSGATPLDVVFLASVATAFDSLGYTYTTSGNTFSVYKPFGVTNLEIDICISFPLDNVFSCPVGYTATPASDMCQKITVTAATFNSSGSTIVAGDNAGVYGQTGTYFYPSIQNNLALPVYYRTSDGLLVDQTGGTITALNVNNGNTFWGNPGMTLTDGRLNNIGLSASTSEYLGFTKCVSAATSGTYYIGLAADNTCRFKVNGDLVVDFSSTTVGSNFNIWSVFPFELNSGLNIIEMEGKNAGSTTAFGAEIYFPTDYATLVAATSTGSSQANAIFSTAEYIGGNWQVGSTIGYSCPAGYSLNGCGTAYTCTEILLTGISNTCSGTCTGDCTTILSDDFPSINSGSTGVYILDTTTATTLPISFNFTGNTDVFSATNATFKYEIYKYNSSISVFTVPPVYKSPTIEYSTFSGTNIINHTIPLSGLSLDGDFLIKGYYEADACTDFLKRLGKRIDTITYKQSSEYQLYDADLDYYFIGIKKADTPQFTQTQPQDLIYYDALALYQQVIIVDDSSETNPYDRTGSTFSLVTEYVGDVMVTVNGDVLAKDIDYTLSGTALTFSGTINNGDVITFIYTRSASQTLTTDSISLNATITSGATGGQGALRYYYNTTTGKYEVYMLNEPVDNSRFIVVLNGVMLSWGIDFYQSITDKKRIIFQGVLNVNDLVTMIYYPKASVINGISLTTNYIGWYIQNQPQSADGEFTLEYSNVSNFSALTVNSTVAYQPLVTNYGSYLTLTGSVGTSLYYRVKNKKNYVSICGDLIESVAYSEVIPVVIQSNAINSY